MKYFKMYTVIFVFLLLLAFGLSVVDFDIKIKGKTPNVVLVGGNVTYEWTYSLPEGTIQPDVIRFGLWNILVIENADTLGRYVPSLGHLTTVPTVGYCTFVEWTGNDTKPTAGFKMVNISSQTHGKMFTVSMFYGNDGSTTRKNASKTLFISVPPIVELEVTNTNATSGDLVTIECKQIQARPDPSFTWYHNGAVVDGQTGRFFLNNEEIEKAHSGSYKCSGENNAGKNESSVVIVTVNEKEKSGKPGVNSREAGGISNGSILAIVFSLLAVVVIVIIVGILWIRRKKQQAPKHAETENGNADESKVRMVPEATEKDQVWL